jgi:hypothetical protein
MALSWRQLHKDKTTVVLIWDQHPLLRADYMDGNLETPFRSRV